MMYHNHCTCFKRVFILCFGLVVGLSACNFEKATDDPQPFIDNSPTLSSEISNNYISIQEDSTATNYENIKTTEDITITKNMYENQIQEMESWLSTLNYDNYAGCYFSENQMILLMKNVAEFSQSDSFKIACDSGWLFTVHSADYSINELQEAIVKLMEQAEKYNIEHIEFADTQQNTISVYSFDNSESNQAAMESFCGISNIVLPNLILSGETELRPGYYKAADVPPDMQSDYFARPYVYYVTIPVTEDSFDYFVLLYDNPRSDEDLAAIIHEEMVTRYGADYQDLNITYICDQIDVVKV